MRVLEALAEIEPAPASIDVARLVAASTPPSPAPTLVDFLRAELAPVLVDADGGAPAASGTDVVLYGFGRIGRLLARILIAHAGGGQGLRLRAIVVRKGSENDLVKRAACCAATRCTAPSQGTIKVDEAANTILANGALIQVIYSDDPGTIDYTAYGIHDAIVVDNTGRWRDEEGLSQHLESTGVARVLLTAPGKGAIKNIVHGINHAAIEPPTASSRRPPARPTRSRPCSRRSRTRTASCAATSRPCTRSRTTRTSSTTSTWATAAAARPC